jgi:predicted Fe-Mo cluster-binding NifX family protein
MSFKIAVATTNEVDIDLGFGMCDVFTIYEVSGDGEYKVLEKRDVTVEESELPQDYGTMKCGGRALVKSDKLADCRAVICSEIGFKVRKNLNSHGISIFDMEGQIDPIIRKIIAYYAKGT